jgi:phage-related protein
MLTEPQVWTIIGLLFATLMGFLTATLTLTTRTISTQIGGLRREVETQIGGLRGEIGSLRNEMGAQIDGLRAEMNARFDTVNTQIATLDRDVQALTNEVFGRRQG